MGHTIGSNPFKTNHVDAETFYQQGESLANLGYYPEALDAFNQAIAAHPGSPTKLTATWVFRAVVLIHLQSYDEALLSCDRALELEPKNVEAWVFRGVTLNYLEQYQDSYASYAKAMKLARPQQTTSRWHFFSGDMLGGIPASYYKRLVQQLNWLDHVRAKVHSLWQRLKRLHFRH